MGAAINQSALDAENQHSQLLTKHFNSITADNFMKMDAMPPKEGEFCWSRQIAW